MFCTKCGKKLKDGVNFCRYCGNPISNKRDNKDILIHENGSEDADLEIEMLQTEYNRLTDQQAEKKQLEQEIVALDLEISDILTSVEKEMKENLQKTDSAAKKDERRIRFCPFCGAPAENAIFCPKCGEKLQN